MDPGGLGWSSGAPTTTPSARTATDAPNASPKAPPPGPVSFATSVHPDDFWKTWADPCPSPLESLQ